MYGETSIDDAAPFNEGDIIDVKVDFEANRIYYFLNNVLQGYVAPTQVLKKVEIIKSHHKIEHFQGW